MNTRAEVQLLSAEECIEIVKNSLNAPVDQKIDLISYNVKIGASDLKGFMGAYFELHVVVKAMNSSGVEEEQKLRYFIKSVPIFDKFHKDECERKGFFRKETGIYKEILPNIQKYAPTQLFARCYYTRPDLIVLEDLAAPGLEYHHLAPGETYTMAHCKLVMEHYAKLHAASIAWEMADDFIIGEKFGNTLLEMQATMKNEWYETGIKGIIFLSKIHPALQDAKSQQFIRGKLYTILCDMEKYTEPSSKYRNVFCHRDSWDRNIFYKCNEKGDPVDCRIVDFQLARYSPPAIDLLFFIYITNNPKQRNSIMDKCLDMYHAALEKRLADLCLTNQLIPKTQFLESCKTARLVVLVLWAICEPLVKMPETARTKMRTQEPEKFDHYMNNDRSEMFLRIMNDHPEYRDSIMTPVEELVKYLLHNDDLY